jgi:ferrous iron transport protein B
MHCHSSLTPAGINQEGVIALVGNPNVGKSVIFQRLTGQHAIVSNYPGTTVEVTRGVSKTFGLGIVLDTPGVVALPPVSEDERVTARVLLNEQIKSILHVGDAKNLRRTLLLAVQLAESGLPMVLALNMTDEAQAAGVDVKIEILSERLSIPIIPTTAIRGLGIESLACALKEAKPAAFRLTYPDPIEAALTEFATRMPSTPISGRSLGLALLSQDLECEQYLRDKLPPEDFQALVDLRDSLQISFVEPLAAVIQRSRMEYVEKLLGTAVVSTGTHRKTFRVWLAGLTTHPVWGLVILGFVLYGLYWFVGIFGAGFLVGLLEEDLFGGLINPWISGHVYRLAPVPLLADLLVGEFGIWTMGMTYALALILPIVAVFFLAFGIMEDSGYLPRLAALTNRIFSKLGLNGKAVLPMVLGLGCVTMATLTTRVLETKRDRLLVTLLLALAIPCSAQLGVVMGLLAGISFTATLIWTGVVTAIFLLVGWLAARMIPGERTLLLVELPPMRWPVFSNVLVKTLARLEWYVKEVVPLFLIGALLMFVLDKTGLLGWLTNAGKPLVTGWLGLPPEASSAFLMGFLRRDFGATGLFLMEAQGLLSPLQVVVAMVTITLFIPCIASVMIISRERGKKTAAAMFFVIIPLALLVGGLLYRFLLFLGWGVV